MNREKLIKAQHKQLDLPDSVNWQLQTVDDTDWQPDDTGVYCLINWQLLIDTVRLDIMSGNNDPIQSFQGKADNVRKHASRWLQENIPDVSFEHIAYIGSQLELADVMRIDYIQDKRFHN